ncbi:flagellar biosynthetic protein FliO [Actinoplanes sp. NPDC051411]|uniref:flagellar biosynthetic protein FliO n=1 Tax=Actinoplanes sp. NPDC051411 TaxID=3155522 RepID=UPI00343220F3
MYELALRIGFSLLVIFGLMWGLARLVRRPMGSGRHHGPLLSVLNRQQLSRGAAVTVVRVADRAIILGVTDQQVSLLGEADLEDFELHHTPHRDHLAVPEGELDLPDAHPVKASGRLDGSILSPRTWTSTIDFLRDRTTRR